MIDFHSARLTDPDRLARLQETGMLGSGREAGLESLTDLAADLLHAPVSMLTMVSADREVIAAATGLPEPWAGRGEMPLRYSYCQYLVSGGEPLRFSDAREHPLVRTSPAIEALRAVAYAGVPVRSRDGLVLGGLCAIDHEPRVWRDDEMETLARLASMAEQTIAFRLLLQTERRRRAAAARSFETEISAAARFRELVESALVGIYLVQEGRLVYANPRMREIFGLEPEEEPPLAFVELVDPADREQVARRLRAPLAGGEASAHFSFRGVRRDGAPIEAEVYGSRTELAGEPALLGTLLDVTDRARAEAALRESAERLKLIERATEDVIWDWDPAAGRVRWSEPGCRLLRYLPEEVGSTMQWHQEQIHPEDRERVARSLQAVLSGIGESWTEEYRFRRGDGEYAAVLDRGYVLRDERAAPIRMIGTMMDVTARRREEEAQRFLSQASALLEDSREVEGALARLTRACIPHLGDLCQIELLEGGRLRRAAIAHAAPLRERELAAAPRERDLSPRLRQLLERGSATLIDPGAGAGAPGEAGGASGPLIVAPLLAGEARVGLLTIAAEGGRRYDRVDLIIAEDLARRVAFAVSHARLLREATEAVRARDEVLAVVSHDLRNPLNVIRMSASMLAEAAPEDEERQRWLDRIGAAAGRMDALIGDLLDLSRMEAGRFRVDPAPADPGELLRTAAEMLEPLAEQKQIRLRARLPSPLPAACADARQLLRVLGNLAGNAIKFTPPGGVVVLDAAEEGDELRISVRDSGPGIPAEQIPRLFERFWQATEGDRRGAGLGLGIARGIVEAHGGRIWAESIPGEGACFHFTLPLA